MEPKLTLGALPRQFAKGAVPVALFFVFLAVASVMDTFGLVPAVLALGAVGVLTPSRIVWAETRYVAAVAATLAAALVCAGIVVDSWLALPIVWAVMAPAAAVHGALRLCERRGARRGDALLVFAIGIATFAATSLVITAGTLALGLATIAVLGGLLALRWRVGPPSFEA